ncbi:MAG TPA: Lrp/AsnC family transcriptional regulator [Pseudonocardia sp.]|jgi:DNA-binding Lrp family transcriptional regulator|nr:Lrp/AsnC family transcriptional regulator [Pseudonocardia sp.]
MLDSIDLGLIHALQVDGRATFSQIGHVLGTSVQTVTRRYRRLRTEAGLRVVGLPDPGPTGQTQWLVRLTCAPHTAVELANALATRPDTSWVKLGSGGTEIIAIVTGASAAPDHRLLLHDIPRTTSITSVSAHYLLHTYLGGPTVWAGRPAVLDEDQRRQLAPNQHAVRPDPRPVDDTDGPLLTALRRDGRASNAELASATGWSPASVARRLNELRTSGAIFFDVDIDPIHFGITTRAMIWMAVAPAAVEELATTLVGHPELAFVAATTGSTNLVADVLCTSPAALHHYLTRRLGALPAIRSMDTVPLLRTVKASATVGPRLSAVRRRRGA